MKEKRSDYWKFRQTILRFLSTILLCLSYQTNPSSYKLYLISNFSFLLVFFLFFSSLFLYFYSFPKFRNIIRSVDFPTKLCSGSMKSEAVVWACCCLQHWTASLTFILSYSPQRVKLGMRTFHTLVCLLLQQHIIANLYIFVSFENLQTKNWWVLPIRHSSLKYFFVYYCVFLAVSYLLSCYFLYTHCRS